MFLVTTADQRSWKLDEEILFLGEWCRIYKDRGAWSALKHQVQPYHWDDRGKLLRDQIMLKEVYERYLAALALQLDRVHGSARSERYWRIVAGPWLRFFVEILFDRYCSVVAAQTRTSDTWILASPAFAWVPEDFSRFAEFFKDDPWNHFIYSEIIKTVGTLPYTELTLANLPAPAARGGAKAQLRAALTIANNWYARMLPGMLNRIVLVASYFGRIELTRLQLALGQAPYPHGPELRSPAVPLDPARRDALKISIARNAFESLLERLIPQQLPTAQLEAYEAMRAGALRWFPREPSAIVTANGCDSDEFFKIWAAEQSERGVPLLLCQHGGQYGVAGFGQFEDHEIAISDRFYSWGWQQASQPKIRRMPANKLILAAKRIRPTAQGKILWALAGLPRYSYILYSVPIASQFLAYLEDQIAFWHQLDGGIRASICLRLYPSDFGWNVRARLADAGLGSIIDDRGQGFYTSLNSSRLCVSTYNATTYLETLAANYPTLMFWNPVHWELRPDAQGLFDLLRKAGILHDTPQAAATKLNEIYPVTNEWWQSAEVQQARRAFCETFVYTGHDWMHEWKRELLTVESARQGTRR